MPASKETINLELFNALKSRGFDPIARTPRDKQTSNKDASLFVFKFVKNGQSYGPARVGIDKDRNLVLYTNDRLESSPHSKSKNSDYDDSWKGLQKFLRSFATRRGLQGFKRVSDRYLQSDMEMQNQESRNLNEGYYPMGRKNSYSDSIPEVKILLQHTRQIEEGEQRYRNVARIFVENANGERFLLPTKRPGIAKVYARHIAEGGTPYDDRGLHITSLVEEYTKMAGFVRATKNGQFNESAQRLVNEGVAHYQNLRETLTRMISQRGYNKYFDAYTPVLNEESDDSASLNELFVQETLDPRIESVMPILKKLSKNINEMNEVKELEEWAESITEVEDETTKTLAEPATKMLEGHNVHDQIEGVKNAVMHRIAMQNPELLKDLDNLEMAVADAASWFVGDGIEELGSSDISAIVKDVASRMSERGVQIDELSGDLLDRASKKAADKATQWDIRKHQVQNFLEPGDKDKDLVKKFGKAAQHYEKMSDKMAGHNEKMRSKLSKAKWASELPGKIKNLEIDEAPGAETLAHNQSTEKKNLKAFGLAEGFADPEHAADEVMQSMGGTGEITRDDIEDAVLELQNEMDDPYKLNVPEVVNIVMDRLQQKGIMVPDVNEDLDANQKRAGQLGPTEKVGPKGAVGKLVGASESVESDDLNRIKEMIGYK